MWHGEGNILEARDLVECKNEFVRLVQFTYVFAYVKLVLYLT